MPTCIVEPGKEAATPAASCRSQCSEDTCTAMAGPRSSMSCWLRKRSQKNSSVSLDGATGGKFDPLGTRTPDLSAAHPTDKEERERGGPGGRGSVGWRAIGSKGPQCSKELGRADLRGMHGSGQNRLARQPADTASEDKLCRHLARHVVGVRSNDQHGRKKRGKEQNTEEMLREREHGQQRTRREHSLHGCVSNRY